MTPPPLHPDDAARLRERLPEGLALLRRLARRVVSTGEGADPRLLRPISSDDAAALEAAALQRLPAGARYAIANLVDLVRLGELTLSADEVTGVALLFGEALVQGLGFRWCTVVRQPAASLAVADAEARWAFYPERDVGRAVSGEASNTLGMSFSTADLAALDGSLPEPGELRRI